MFTALTKSFGQILDHSLDVLGLNEKRCATCREPFTPSTRASAPFSSIHICPSCQDKLAVNKLRKCSSCAMPLAAKRESGQDESLNTALCQHCREDPKPWQGIACHGPYSGLLRDAILALKYSGALHLCGLFADLLLECSQCLPRPDLLVPVPLSTSRLKKRGYNQALEIGKRLSALSGIPISWRALYRVKDIRAQEELGAMERRENVKGVFKASQEARGAAIWLLDDVMTTGSTLKECSQALLAMGASRVSLLFLARTGA